MTLDIRPLALTAYGMQTLNILKFYTEMRIYSNLTKDGKTKEDGVGEFSFVYVYLELHVFYVEMGVKVILVH